jgi:hypothetical protein
MLCLSIAIDKYLHKMVNTEDALYLFGHLWHEAPVILVDSVHWKLGDAQLNMELSLGVATNNSATN